MPKTILFVCQGNSIRSIMAEAAFNRFCRKDYTAKSAGTLPIRHIDEKAKKVLQEAGIPLKKKEPTPLTYEGIVSAKKVILMNSALPNFPSQVPNHLLKRWDIPEVVGKPIEEYRKARDMIIQKVKELIRKLE